MERGRPVANRILRFSSGSLGEYVSQPVKTDGEGRFVTAHLPAGPITICVETGDTERGRSVALAHEELAAGETKVVQIVTRSRTVTGRLEKAGELPAGLKLAECMLELAPNVRPPKPPAEMDTLEKSRHWFEAWLKTPEGRSFAENAQRHVLLSVNADGTFSSNMVAPGEYYLTGGAFDRNGDRSATLAAVAVTVPDSDSDSPIDLGRVVLQAVKNLAVGDPAPDFEVQTLDGQTLKLAALRGKYVLLDFWATWCGPCVAEVPNLVETYAAFGHDARFRMISLSLDTDQDAPRKFAKEKKTAWIQGFLGDWSQDNVTKAYGVDGIPEMFLVGPDGRIVARGMRGVAIKQAVERALGPP